MTKRRYNYQKGFSAAIIILFIILAIYTISLLAPLIWGFITSFKGKYELRNNVFGLPKKWMFSNYVDAFKAYRVRVEWKEDFRYVYLWEMILYSFLYSFGGAFVKTLCTCVVAYVVAKFKHYRFSKILYSVVLIVMMLPIVGSLPAELAMARSLGFYNQIWGIWLMSFNFLGIYFFVFHAAFVAIPKDYAEAAYMDGANEWQVMIKVMLPMVRNTFFVIMLLQFIAYWNDYQTPMMYLPSYPTLAYGLYSFSLSTSQNLASVPMKLTGSMIMLLPILILFLMFHKKMIGNVSIGGIKE